MRHRILTGALLLTLCSTGCAGPPSHDVWQFRTRRPWILAGDSEGYSPVVAGKTVFFCGGYMWNDWSELVALDAATGEPRWRVPVGSCSAPPMIVGSTVIAFADPDHGRKQIVRGLDIESGRPMWQDEFDPHEFEPRFRAALGGFVYLSATNGPVMRLDAASGGVETITLEGQPEDRGWLAATPDGVAIGAGSATFLVNQSSAPPTPGPVLEIPKRLRPMAAVAASTVIVLTDNDHALAAFSLTDGRMLWSRRFESVQSEPVITGGRVLVNVLAPRFELQALHVATGERLWAADDSSFYQPVVLAGRVYNPGRRSVAVLDEKTGALSERVQAAREVVTSPIPAGDLVIFATIDGVVHAVRRPG